MNTLWTLPPEAFASLKSDGICVIGTLRNPQAHDLFHDFGARRHGSGGDEAFVCWGSVKMMVGDGVRHDPRPALFPVCLKRAVLYANGDEIKASVSEDEEWQFNPPLEAHLKERGIAVPPQLAANPLRAATWLKTRLGYGTAEVATEAYIGRSGGDELLVELRAQEAAETQDLALAS